MKNEDRVQEAISDQEKKEESGKNAPPGKLKLALLSKVFPPFSYGGTESYSSELASELARRDDIELHVLCFSSVKNPLPEEELEKLKNEAPYTLHILGRFFKRFNGPRSLVNYGKVYAALSRTLKELRPHLLQTIGVYSETILALGVARKLGIPTIVFPRGTDINRKSGSFTRFIHKRFVFGRADAIFSQTRMAQENLRKRGLVPQGQTAPPLKVVPNALDLSTFEAWRVQEVPEKEEGLEGEAEGEREREREAAGFRLLWVGRFEAVKNPALALDIFHRFVQKTAGEGVGEGGAGEARLVMAGDGELFGELKKRTQVMENVVLKGKLERSEVFRLMGECDVLINTSRSEGFPVTFLEAMAHGLPIVCFDVSANGEIVRDGRNGLLAREGDTEDFAGKLLELYENPELRRSMGERNRAVVQDYDWAKVIDGMVGIYRELAKVK